MDRRTFTLTAAGGAIALGILPRLRPLWALAARSPFTALRDRYFLRVLELNPVTATYLGGDAYSPTLRAINGRLRDYRPAALSEEARFYQEVGAELAAIEPSSLSVQERIDHGAMTSQVAFILHQLVDLRYHERAVDTYVAEPFRGVDWQIQQMADLGEGRLGTADEWSLVEARLRAVPAYLRAARDNLLAGKRTANRPDRRMVERDGMAGSRSNAEYFRDTLPALAVRYTRRQPFAPALLRRLRTAARAAADAYVAFATFLQRELNPAEDSANRFAVGEREYAWRVRNNLRDPRTPAQLYAYGLEQVALYQGLIFRVAEQVAREAGLNLPWGSVEEKRRGVPAVMAHLSREAPRDDDELLRWYVQAGERAVAYGRERGLFNVPAEYRLDVYPTPPVLRSTIDAAYYPAPPFKKSGVGRFYLTPTGNDPAALRLNNRASVADTAVHEGFPGHDWHFKFLTENAAQISNVRWLTAGAVEDSSSMWSDSMATEGWALYSEELMSEATPERPYGFYTAAEYLYELQGQLLRAVRIVVDVGIHTERMTFDEAVDYFTEARDFSFAACSRSDADAEARAVCESARRAIYRYSKWPTQAITYNLGKNAIVQLREAYRAARGDAYNAREFHERLLRMGTISPHFFRDALLSGD